MNAVHDMIAVIYAYISLLDHDLVLALAFSGFDLAKDLMSMIGSRSRRGAAQRREETRHVLHVLLSAGRGRPARTPFGFLVRALPVVVPATKCGVCCLSLVGPRICWRVGGTGDIPVEALFPQGRELFRVGLLLRLVAGLGD